MLGGYISLVVGLLNVGPQSLGWLRAIGGGPFLPLTDASETLADSCLCRLLPAALGVYASVFGMLGLIPTPRPTRVPRRD